MQVLMSLLGNKFVLYGMIFILGAGIFQVNSCNKDKAEERLETYKRQLSGQLSEKERELQELNVDLGVARSQIVTQQELIARVENEREEINAEFSRFVEKHNLVIKSRDRTIAALKQQIDGGTTTVIVSDEPECNEISEKCTISYTWNDPQARFNLQDPDIFTPDDETFNSDQKFKVYGEVYEQENGSLQTRRLVLREVALNPNGSYSPIPGGVANLVDSKFEYYNPPTIDIDGSWTDIFNLRVMATGGVLLSDDPGALQFGIGAEFLQWNGFGLGGFASLDFKEPGNIAPHLSIQYNPTLWNTELNVGIYTSAGTPISNFMNKYVFSAGLVFYLNN